MQSVDITGYSLQILQKKTRRVPVNPCKHLQCGAEITCDTIPLLISTDFLKYPLELKKNQLVYTEIDPKKTSDRPDKLE